VLSLLNCLSIILKASAMPVGCLNRMWLNNSVLGNNRDQQQNSYSAFMAQYASVVKRHIDTFSNKTLLRLLLANLQKTCLIRWRHAEAFAQPKRRGLPGAHP